MEERPREAPGRGSDADAKDSGERTVRIPRLGPLDIAARFGARARERARLAVSSREGQ